jgi:hypothetical protein
VWGKALPPCGVCQKTGFTCIEREKKKGKRGKRKRERERKQQTKQQRELCARMVCIKLEPKGTEWYLLKQSTHY